MEGAGADGDVAAIGGVGLPRLDQSPFLPNTFRSPALDRAASRVDCAGVKAASADGAVAALRGVGLAIVVPSPALDRAASRADCAGVHSAGADGDVAALRGVGLAYVVIAFTDSPARELPASRADCAGVQEAGADGAVAAIGGVGLPVIVVSPARDRAARADRASVVIAAGADGDVARRGGADRDLRAPQPAACPRAGREVTRRRLDPLPIRRRECELDPAVAQQAGVDPADRAAVYLYGATPQPSSYVGVGREVALRGQHARAACRLPTEFNAAIIEQARDDAPGALVVALRGGGRCEVGGDDRSDGG